MHRRGGIALLALLALGSSALAQAPEDKAGPAKVEKKDEKKDEAKKPPARPRVQLKRERGSVGDDAAGGGAATAPGSKGGTPGTPSGSFTR